MLLAQHVPDFDHHAADMILVIRNTFNRLASQTDLSPNNPVVNAALTAYVNTIIEADKAIADVGAVLDHPDVIAVQDGMLDILSRAEFEMERYFATRLGEQGPMPLSGLSQFWYRANYKALVGIEIGGIKAYGGSLNTLKDSRPMAFIGSGPLPLSAIDYHLMTGKSCVCIEIDEQAAADSARLIRNVGLENVIQVRCADGRDVDYADFSMIFVAALVESKSEVLDRIQSTARNALIGVRSADGLKKLLYKSIAIPEIEERGFRHVGTTLGTPQAVNSTCFFRPAA